MGLDPLLYDPLPMGISVEFKDAEVARARAEGWHVWERDNIAGRRRPQARSPAGLETLVALRPERLIDYVRMEREASEPVFHEIDIPRVDQHVLAHCVLRFS